MPDNRSDLLRELLGARGRLIVVSNRGPITFGRDESAPGHLTAARGSGGLVTALGELGRHAPLTWVAAAMSQADRTARGVLTDHHNGPQGSRVRALVEETLPG